MTSYAIQAGALRENPNSGPDGVGVQADIAYTLEARAEVQAVCGIAAPKLHHANDNVPTSGQPLRFLSVCSGIEAASVAWHPLGWRAVAFSEIEKFPSAVLAHHYPDVPNLGDFTKIDATKLGQVDILAGGTPCQAFSVAGLRQGLDDARGNLTLKFVELAHELAGYGKTDGNGLRNVVWENVVGVLSDKGNAFGCFLAGLVGADSAVVPGEKPAAGQSNKQWRWSRADGFHIPIWPRHGMVAGPKGRAAWAVKDAQFFGVAQRRRRVLVVADFGNGADPAAVLFEPEGVFRHPPSRGEAGKDVAGAVAKGFASSGDGYWREGIGPLRAREQDSHESLAVYAPEIARCVATREGSSQDYESTTMVAIGVTGTTSHALTAEGADASEDGTGRGTPVVVAFDARQADVLVHGDKTGPLDCGFPGPAICFTAKDYGADASSDLAPTLRAGGFTGSHANGGVMPAIAQTVAIRGRDGGATAELGGEVATALRASQGGGDKPHVLTSAVRRLTPMECERLQGFPDGYTAIPWRGKPADQCPDGPRYKSLGNSWAVPKFTWLGRRIAQFMPPTSTPLAANDNQTSTPISANLSHA